MKYSLKLSYFNTLWIQFKHQIKNLWWDAQSSSSVQCTAEWWAHSKSFLPGRSQDICLLLCFWSLGPAKVWSRERIFMLLKQYFIIFHNVVFVCPILSLFKTMWPYVYTCSVLNTEWNINVVHIAKLYEDQVCGWEAVFDHVSVCSVSWSVCVYTAHWTLVLLLAQNTYPKQVHPVHPSVAYLSVLFLLKVSTKAPMYRIWTFLTLAPFSCSIWKDTVVDYSKSRNTWVWIKYNHDCCQLL